MQIPEQLRLATLCAIVLLGAGCANSNGTGTDIELKFDQCTVPDITILEDAIVATHDRDNTRHTVGVCLRTEECFAHFVNDDTDALNACISSCLVGGNLEGISEPCFGCVYIGVRQVQYLCAAECTNPDPVCDACLIDSGILDDFTACSGHDSEAVVF